jgi:hypothetical protein
LRALIEKVKTDGAYLNLFFDVNEIYGRLRDRHVSVNQGTSVVFVLQNTIIYFSSEEVITGLAKNAKYRVISDSPGEFKLAVDLYDGTGGVYSTKNVKSLDGKDPLSFFTEMAMDPLGSITNYKVSQRVSTAHLAFLVLFN